MNTEPEYIQPMGAGMALPHLAAHLACYRLRVLPFSWRVSSHLHVFEEEYRRITSHLFEDHLIFARASGQVVRLSAPGCPALLVSVGDAGKVAEVGFIPGEDYFSYATMLPSIVRADSLFCRGVAGQVPGRRLHVQIDAQGRSAIPLRMFALAAALTRNGYHDGDAVTRVLLQAYESLRRAGDVPVQLAETTMPDGTQVIFSRDRSTKFRQVPIGPLPREVFSITEEVKEYVVESGCRRLAV